ncbi:hypothetical protein EsH8_XI_000003 [Colletotrichum jinshuiense]
MASPSLTHPRPRLHADTRRRLDHHHNHDASSAPAPAPAPMDLVFDGSNSQRDDTVSHEPVQGNGANTAQLQETLRRIVEAAQLILSHPACPTNTQSTFALDHPRALDLVHNALLSSGVESHKLRIEYRPDYGEMRLKLPESPLHSRFITAFDTLLRAAAASSDKLPQLMNINVSVTTQGDNGRQGSLVPDYGWSANPDDIHGRLVLEVAYSQDRRHVAEKCKEYICNTPDYVRAAIAIKIFYPQDKSDYEAILDHLDDCYVGL